MAALMNFISSVLLVCGSFCPISTVADEFGFALDLSSTVTNLTASELAQYYLERADTLNKYDDCRRTCVRGERRLCYYEFILELYSTMSPACGNCSSGVIEDCFADQCVPADGIERGFMSINRKLPGPAIEVCKEDLIVVKMTNSMTGMSSTIHWHGMLQTGTPYMDGVPFFTQCPVAEGTSFLYSYWAENSGTRFYHSHSGYQLTNGIVSSLIIRDVPANDPHYGLYDVDNHTLFIYDWTHTYSEMYTPGLVFTTPESGVPESFLINGHGVTFNKETNSTTTTPYATFHVSSGLRYRFRTVGGVGLMCPVRIQIENHTMTVIAADGTNIQPLDVNSFIIYPGEKYDFILDANQTSGNYWIHAQGVGLCSVLTSPTFQTAVLAYDQSTSTLGLIPSSPKPTYDGYDIGVILNDQNSFCNDSISICPSQLQSLSVIASTLTDQPDYVIPLRIEEIPLTKKEVFAQNYDDWISFMVLSGGSVEAKTINKIQSIFQASPYMTQPEDIDWSLVCDKDNLPARCNGSTVCKCDHGIAVKLNSVVHLLLINNDTSTDLVSHPAHLHGHDFFVLKSGHFDGITTIESIQNWTLEELLADNPSPVMKDTVALPAYGYVIIRFIANNPGFWLMHCHIEHHLALGMMMGWKVGEYEDFPEPPADFPKCGNFG